LSHDDLRAIRAIIDQPTQLAAAEELGVAYSTLRNRLNRIRRRIGAINVYDVVERYAAGEFEEIESYHR